MISHMLVLCQMLPQKAVRFLLTKDIVFPEKKIICKLMPN